MKNALLYPELGFYLVPGAWAHMLGTRALGEARKVVQGCMVQAQGRLRQHLRCDFLRFLPVFIRSFV